MHDKNLLKKTTTSLLSALLFLAPAAFADYEELDAPFTLDFGLDAEHSTGEELLMTPTADPFSLWWDALEMGVGHASAMAVVANREPGARFSLHANVRPESFVPGKPDDRLGFAVLGGPHDPPGNAFDTTDGEFYSLTWSPSTDGPTSLIEIREGFEGALIAQEVWEGRHPNNNNSSEGLWDIYRFEGQGVYDATGALTLTFTLTDQLGHTQSVSASIADPREGNLFGFGGTLSSDPFGDPRFSFLNFSVSSNVFLNERFVDGERLLQDLPRTSAWYGSRGSSGAGNPLSQPADGIITMDTSANAHLLSYFTDGGAVTLGVGETLRVAFDFQVAGAASRDVGVRIGVMDSSQAPERETGDAQSTGGIRFRPYTGYGAFFNPNGGSPENNSMRLRRRNPDHEDSGSLLSTVGGVWPNLRAGGGEIVIIGGQDYSAEILITRQAGDSVALTFNLFGDNLGPEATVSFTDPATHSSFSFDTFGIWVNGNAADSLSLTSVDVEVISPDPAPDGVTFAAWQEEHFPGETDPDIIGPDAAPAGDGVANFIKYAFGLDPFTPVTLSEVLESAIVDGKLEIVYIERTDAEDIEYIPQASLNLIDWGTGPGNVETESEPLPEENLRRVTARAVLDGSEAKAFLRVSLQEK